MAEETSGWVWLRHPDTGGVQQFAPSAADIWRQRGWVDTDPPAEPDPTREPTTTAAESLADPAPPADPDPAAKPAKTKTSKERSDG